MGGFSVNPTLSESTYENATFGLYCEAGNLKIYENGNSVYTVFEGGSITPSDLFKVEYNGSVVNYYYNGSIVYTSLQTITQPLHIFFPLLTENEGVINVCVIETPAPSPTSTQTPTITPSPSEPLYPLTINVQSMSGGESVILDGITYTANTTVNILLNTTYFIEGVPSPGYILTGWGGAGVSIELLSGNTWTVSINSTGGSSVTPQYEEIPTPTPTPTPSSTPPTNYWEITNCSSVFNIIVNFGTYVPNQGEIYNLTMVGYSPPNNWNCWQVVGTSAGPPFAPVQTINSGPWLDCPSCPL
jgi:hypothetical protein